MRRILAAIPLAAAAAAIAIFVEPGPIGAALRAGIGADALPPHPEIVAVVETPAPPSPLDAALILRATLRFQPRGVTFFDPLAGPEGRALLEAKLGETSIPIQFAAPAKEITVPASLPDAGRWTERITFDRLMVRTERGDRGEISADLDRLFRDRWIAVQTPGGNGAAELALALNHYRPPTVPLGAAWVAVALAASLPWWRLGRAHRGLAALGLTCAWLLLVLALIPSHVAVPFAGMLVLPLLALIPPR